MHLEQRTQFGLLFPGQGAQHPRMLEGVRDLPAFAERYRLICECAGADVIDGYLRSHAPSTIGNLTSSLLTVLVSTLCLDRFREVVDAAPHSFAGYSVGQWTAMYAAGMLDFESLVQVITVRCRLMDECASDEPGGMLAVIGISESVLLESLNGLRVSGHRIFLSNRNAVGQFSVSGSEPAVKASMDALSKLNPKKLIRLPVSGAWHSPLLQGAQKEFSRVLSNLTLRQPNGYVADNVTGGWMSSEPSVLRDSLAAHLTHPVEWQRNVGIMVQAGCTTFFEVGYGLTLTKFGFFIDRESIFVPFYDRCPNFPASDANSSAVRAS